MTAHLSGCVGECSFFFSVMEPARPTRTSDLARFCCRGCLAQSRQRALLRMGAVVRSQLRTKNKPRIIESGGSVRSVSVPSLLAVRWPPPFSKYTIWVMVGIQGRVAAIDFSAFAAHGSKLGTRWSLCLIRSCFLIAAEERAAMLFFFLWFSAGSFLPAFCHFSSFLPISQPPLLPGTVSADKALR